MGIIVRLRGETCAWSEDEKTAEEVGKLLQLKKTGNILVDSALVSNWLTFVEARYKESPTDFSEILHVIYKQQHSGQITRCSIRNRRCEKDTARKLMNILVDRWTDER